MTRPNPKQLKVGDKGIPKIGWKACLVQTKEAYDNGHTHMLSEGKGYNRTAIIKLAILGDATMDGIDMYAYSGKCRTSKAKVLAIYGLKRGEVAVSSARTCSTCNRTRYQKGRMVEPKLGFEYSDLACASGIHFFRTKKEALAYRSKL